MKKKIFTINYQIPGASELNLDFSSKQSLMDADIVVFNPAIPYYERSLLSDGQYQGKTCYGEHGSFQLKEDRDYWKKELSNALKSGKTVFLLLNNKQDFFLDTGTRSHTGTGRNRSTTINVGFGHNYEFLPVDIGTITSANGSHITLYENSLFQSFFEQFKSDLEYRVYLDNLPESTAIFTGKDKSKILGAIYKVGAGHLVTLPYLNYDDVKFTEYKEDEKGNDQAFWTKGAIVYGKNLIQQFVTIDKGLSLTTNKSPEPNWVLKKDFSSKEEQRISKKISECVKQIEKLKEEGKILQKQLLEEQAIKDLLYEQGKPLESAVIEALNILGYKAENYNDGELELDQVITSPEKHRFIGECEGKDSKDINITKFRQLLESLNADFARDEVEEKAFGILFGNSERLKDPAKRALDFTQKCKIGAEREKIALVKTTDLFTVVKYLKENKNEKYKKACRKAIYDGLGKIIEFPKISMNK